MASVKKARLRVGKNKKKAWKKCDINDVEEFLEETRFEERIGGRVSDKPDSELFSIEKSTNDPKQKALKKQKKALKCFQSIGSYSKVPCPITLTVEPYSKRINNVLSRAADRRERKAIRKSLQKVKVDPPKTIHTSGTVVSEIRDLWDDTDKSVDPEIESLINFRDEYTCKRMPKVPPHRYQKPSLLPSVEIPSSGASYNPDYVEHQNLLREALTIEKGKQKQELHLKRILTDMFPSKAEAPTEESILQEMSQGLFDEENSDSDADPDATYVPWNMPVSSENRVPKARKRRKKERKEQDRLRKVEKLQKKRLNEVYRLRSIKKEIRQENEATEKKVMRKQQLKIEKMYQPKTIGKYKYQAPDLEVNLTSELCDSLRKLKTEGNLLEDRYKSLQRRNLIEPRIKQKNKRRYKLKVQIKRSHRNFT